MNARVIVTVTCVAAGVMAATLVMFWPARLGAAGQAAPARLAPAIATPTLTAAGCKLTPRAVIGTDGTAVLELTAVNPTDKPAHIEVTAALFSQPPSSPMSRMVPVPKQIWTECLPVSLVAGETTVVILKTDKKVAAARQVFFSVAGGGSAIRTRPVTAAPAVGPGRAASAQAARGAR